jgi:hypothetical protein
MKTCRINIDSFDLEQILTEEEMHHFTIRKYKKGEIRYPSDQVKLLIMKKGKGKVSFLEDGKEFILYYLRRYNFYVMHPDTVIEFLEDSVMLELKASDFPGVFNNKLFCNLVLNSFTKIMMIEKEIIKGLVFNDCKKRIACFLLDIVETGGVETDDGIEIDLDVKIKDIANIVALQRQTASKIINEMIQDNILEKKEKNIYLIKDRAKLEEIVF